MNIELGSEYIVYDGPGLLADVSKNQRIKQCSTFQCIIHLLTHRNHLLHANIKYYTEALPSLERVKISQEQLLSINLPNMNCLDTVCTVAIHIPDGYHIIVTVNKLLRIGLYDETCLYGGLVASEQLTDDYRQSGTVCEHYHGTEHPRKFYSHKSSLILILYWYKMYSKINITVDISSTSCELVNIDICHYHNVCKEDTSLSCLLYLNYVTQYASINISIEVTHSSLTPFIPILILTPLQNKCYVLALLQNETIRDLMFCQICMNLVRSKMKAIRGSGFIRIEYATRDVCSSQLCHLNTLNVYTMKRRTIENGTMNGGFSFNIVHLYIAAYPYLKFWAYIILQKLNIEVMAVTYELRPYSVGCSSFVIRKQAVIVLEITRFTGNLSSLRGYEIKIEAMNRGYQKKIFGEEHFLDSLVSIKHVSNLFRKQRL